MLPAPGNTSVLVAAVDWIQSLVFGTMGSILAIAGVAWLGFEMLTGRVSIRSAAKMVLGLFILFGAPGMARELRELAMNTPQNRASVVFQPSPSSPPPRLPQPPPPNPDPYAGASVPM